jgi:hypothetical protein
LIDRRDNWWRLLVDDRNGYPPPLISTTKLKKTTIGRSHRLNPAKRSKPNRIAIKPPPPSHKDYEEILKNNHLVRLRVAAKKQTQPPTHSHSPQQPVEQYLKEVNPTTKTAYQRPTNYLRFNGQSPALKQEQNEETPLKQQPYRYILQPDLQQQ